MWRTTCRAVPIWLLRSNPRRPTTITMSSISDRQQSPGVEGEEVPRFSREGGEAGVLFIVFWAGRDGESVVRREAFRSRDASFQKVLNKVVKS